MRSHIKGYNHLLILTVFISVCSCIQTADPYSKLAKEEMGKGIRVDSLFLGIRFGMTRKDFFGYCWELNKKGIITDGTSNTIVLYKMDSGLRYPASMNFYPDFYENRIYHMRVSFQYNGWAPWN